MTACYSHNRHVCGWVSSLSQTTHTSHTFFVWLFLSICFLSPSVLNVIIHYRVEQKKFFVHVQKQNYKGAAAGWVPGQFDTHIGITWIIPDSCPLSTRLSHTLSLSLTHSHTQLYCSQQHIMTQLKKIPTRLLVISGIYNKRESRGRREESEPESLLHLFNAFIMLLIHNV